MRSEGGVQARAPGVEDREADVDVPACARRQGRAESGDPDAMQVRAGRTDNVHAVQHARAADRLDHLGYVDALPPESVYSGDAGFELFQAASQDARGPRAAAGVGSAQHLHAALRHQQTPLGHERKPNREPGPRCDSERFRRRDRQLEALLEHVDEEL
eukprot:2849199-Pyramimonas_sp.AAC.1